MAKAIHRRRCLTGLTVSEGESMAVRVGSTGGQAGSMGGRAGGQAGVVLNSN